MSKKDEKTSKEAKVQQEVASEVPEVFNMGEATDSGETTKAAEAPAETPAETPEATKTEDADDGKPKVEDKEIVEIEQKVIALVIIGNLHAVVDVLKGYQWKDTACKSIWDMCIKLNNERRYVSSATVQMALNAQKSDVDVSAIMTNIPSPNLLIPFANKLVQSQKK